MQNSLFYKFFHKLQLIISTKWIIINNVSIKKFTKKEREKMKELFQIWWRFFWRYAVLFAALLLAGGTAFPQYDKALRYYTALFRPGQYPRLCCYFFSYSEQAI